MGWGDLLRSFLGFSVLGPMLLKLGPPTHLERQDLHRLWLGECNTDLAELIKAFWSRVVEQLCNARG